jgi:hypothetical protein
MAGGTRRCLSRRLNGKAEGHKSARQHGPPRGIEASSWRTCGEEGRVDADARAFELGRRYGHIFSTVLYSLLMCSTHTLQVVLPCRDICRVAKAVSARLSLTWPLAKRTLPTFCPGLHKLPVAVELLTRLEEVAPVGEQPGRLLLDDGRAWQAGGEGTRSEPGRPFSAAMIACRRTRTASEACDERSAQVAGCLTQAMAAGQSSRSRFGGDWHSAHGVLARMGILRYNNAVSGTL